MKYLSLTLAGYKRFALNGINFLKITPNEKIQLILGSNGSGKSSLLKELSPLPANSADYHKDGYKIAEILHRGIVYKVSTTFSPTQKNSFIKNDEELNQGGTASVQKELCKIEFGITPAIHDLMTGASLFHNMGPTERRSWFTRFSDTNFTYAIGVYQKLKDRLRDKQGAIKLNQTRAVQEANKLLSDDQEKELRKTTELLQNHLHFLLDTKTTITTPTYELKNTLKSTESLLLVVAKSIFTLRKQFTNNDGFTSIEDITNEIIDRQSQLQSIEFTIQQTAKLIEDQETIYQSFNHSNVSNIGDIESKQTELTLKIQESRGFLRTGLQFEHPLETFQSLAAIEDTLSDIITRIVPNPDRTLSRGYYERLSNQLTELKEKKKEYDELQFKLIHIKNEQEHYQSHDALECPQCKHRWKKGYEPVVHSNTLKQIQCNSLILDQLIIEIKKIEEEMQHVQSYLSICQNYLDLARSWPILLPMWSRILEDEILFKHPQQIMTLISTVKEDLKYLTLIHQFQTEITDLLKIKQLSETHGLITREKIEAQLNQLNQSLYDQNERLRNTKFQLNQLKQHKATVIELQAAQLKLEQLLNTYTTSSHDLIKNLEKDTLNDIIRLFQLEISQKEQQLSQIDIQRALVNDIQNQLTILTEEVDVLKIMVKELSPTEGLIAKGLLGFINTFVRQMNSFIRKIWSYPLELIPCLPDENSDIELDYTFMVNVGDRNTVSDVSKGSTAMKEVIDLAFRIVSMKYLHLSEASLILDEFSHSMDNAHRQQAFYVINNLIAQSNFSQIYIVSHFDECYNSLKNADVTVLSPTNIVMPKNTTFNQHVEMR